MKTKTEPHETAYPIFLQEGLSSNSHIDAGLTKREYFASQLMCALVSKYQLKEPEDQVTTAKMALELTDTLIEQLNKTI